MDFELSDDQSAIAQAVAALLARHAGPARAIELAGKGGYDAELERALDAAGFLDVAVAPETGPLEATLVVEAVARAGGVVAAGAEGLAAPAALGRRLPGPVAVADAQVPGPVRFGAHARTLLLLDGDAVRSLALPSGATEPVRSNFGYPFGRIAVAGAGREERLGPGSAERVRAWWRVAIAAEAVGCMRAALDLTVDYVKRRRQFGRAIGSFQAVQHRLAQCAVLVEGARWLVYEAAWRGAPAEAAATAAAHATAAAGQVFAETHQLTGAMGFTREHDLHVFSMRLQALRLEAGGPADHCRAAARARWVEH